jgi:hypothetical protein
VSWARADRINKRSTGEVPVTTTARSRPGWSRRAAFSVPIQSGDSHRPVTSRSSPIDRGEDDGHAGEQPGAMAEHEAQPRARADGDQVGLRARVLGREVTHELLLEAVALVEQRQLEVLAVEREGLGPLGAERSRERLLLGEE